MSQVHKHYTTHSYMYQTAGDPAGVCRRQDLLHCQVQVHNKNVNLLPICSSGNDNQTRNCKLFEISAVVDFGYGLIFLYLLQFDSR